MWQLSAAAREVLRFSHQVNYRLTAFTANQGIVGIPALAGGSVTCDSKSQVRRTGSLDIADPTLFPTSPYSPLSSLGSELRVEYGIVIPRVGTEWVPLITGPIQSTKGKLVRVRPPNAQFPSRDLLVSGLGVTVNDRSKPVADDRFAGPAQTIAGARVVDEIIRLVHETLPGVEVVDLSGSTATAATMEIEKERWQDGVEKLADAAGLEVGFDQLGRLAIRNTPTLDDPPVWRIDAGEGGVLITADLEQTRDQVYNAVMVSGQRTDGTPPVSALVVDDDPASPTRWGGPFGKKLRYFTSPLLTTAEQCVNTGRSQLAKVKGYSTTVQLEIITNPALEGGDVVEIDLGDGVVQRHIIDAVPAPVKPGSQSLTTRSVDLPPEQ